MFFLAKVCACGVYVLGLVEAILNVFGIEPGEPSNLFLPFVKYSSCVLPSGEAVWSFMRH